MDCRVEPGNDPMNILSIQSHVAFGHVGNSAAAFTMQRIGAEVWPVHTVAFSNHTGYGHWRGHVFEADMVREVVRGIAERGVLRVCDGVLSGYLGSAEIGEAILEAVAMVKAANPAARYCCDPVIGDTGRGIFVRPGVDDFIRDRAVPAADIITPNQFELDHLSRRETKSLGQALSAVDHVHALGPKVVLVTSLRTAETPENCVDLLACDGAGKFRVRTPRLPAVFNGAGDAIAALFFVHYLRRQDAGAALTRAASALFGVLSRTAEAGAAEMLLVAAQEELVNPSRVFGAERVGD
jgi:pyridoxine kinase